MVNECLIARAKEIKDKGCLGTLHFVLSPEIDLRRRRRLAEVFFLFAGPAPSDGGQQCLTRGQPARLCATLGAANSSGESNGVTGDFGCGD